MSGIVRDFSLSSVEHLKNIIKQNVDEDGELFLVDWVKDWFIDDLDINDYINDIDTYHAKMVDKYDISTKKFDQILNKVHAVDISYADRFNSIYEGLSSFNALIMNVTALIDPSAVTLDQNAYEELLSGIENIHAENMEVVNKTIENDDAELDDALREVPWYETALDFVAGAGVEFGKNTLEGIAFIPYAIVDGIFGTNLNERLSDNLDYLEESYVLPHIGNKTAYYYGRAAGDVITMVVGAYGMIKGIVTIAGGITITGGGAALSATGVGSIIGAPAIAVSVPVVLAGAAELGISGAVFANGYDNLNDNIKMASTDKVSEVSSSKQSSVENNLKSNSFKDKIKNIDDNIISDMDARGGHIKARHIGQSREDMAKRAAKLGEYNPSAAVTTYSSEDVATKAVKDALNGNVNKIENWIKNPQKPRLTIYENHSYSVGEGVSASGVFKEGIQRTVTVLEIDTTSPLGFRIITSYPKY